MIPLKPEQWTHHHTQRMFHLSLGTCLLFVSGVIATGLVSVWLQAGAQTPATETGDVQITAVVPGVTPGPIEPLSPGNGYCCIAEPATPPVYPGPAPISPPGSVTGPSQPESPIQPKPGTQPGVVPQPGTAPDAPGADRVFDIQVVVSDLYKNIYPKQRLVLQVTLFDSDEVNHSQEVSYTVTDDQGEVVVQAMDTVELAGRLSYGKVFYTNVESLPGQYTITVRIARNGKTAIASDTFTIVQPPLIVQATEQDPAILWSVLSLLLLILLFAITAYHKVALHSSAIKQGNY